MYIVENRVFYNSGKFKLDEIQIKENQKIFLDIFPDVKISFSSYWFNKFNNDNEYIEFSFERTNIDFFDKYFSKNSNVDNLIENIFIKTHPNGITSTEVFFKVEDEIVKFDDYLEEFSSMYSSTLFEIAYKINLKLQELKLINFSKHYKYGVILKDKNSFSKFFSKFFVKNEKLDTLNLMQDSYLLRVHFVVQSDEQYFKIKDFYFSEDIKSIECLTKINDTKFKVTLYWAFALFQTSDININTISKLMDIDSYTMNEIVVYNVAGDTYTDLMYSIDFNLNSDIKSNELFEMYKINSFFLQKNKLNELYFNEDVNNFVTYQREIEKFPMQQSTYENSEEKFLQIYNAVETNEKSKANRIIQYILTALTLLTIISVSKDIVEFVKAEFLNENTSLKIEVFSRSEFLIFLLIAIVFLFLKLRQYINKI